MKKIFEGEHLQSRHASFILEELNEAFGDNKNFRIFVPFHPVTQLKFRKSMQKIFNR